MLWVTHHTSSGSGLRVGQKGFPYLRNGGLHKMEKSDLWRTTVRLWLHSRAGDFEYNICIYHYLFCDAVISCLFPSSALRNMMFKPNICWICNTNKWNKPFLYCHSFYLHNWLQLWGFVFTCVIPQPQQYFPQPNFLYFYY